MIIIIGAGLSGLITGYLLKKKGIAFKILESRNRVGGRINTIYRGGEAPVEMGATWFYDQHENLSALLKDLNIESFAQFMNTDVFYEESTDSPARIVEIPKSAPSYRISGGTSALVNALLNHLEPEFILLNQTVKKIIVNENSIVVKADHIFEAEKVVLSLPPKLWSKRIIFEPKLAENLVSVAHQTQTWMEDSIKVALTFSQPFWNEENLPRTLFSNVGPVTEFYDHCDITNSKYALCGFIATSLKHLNFVDRKKLVINQLKSIFGSQINDYQNYEECVWSMESNTFESSDPQLFPHQNNGHPVFQNSFFSDCLIISGSETSPQYAGYMEGAVLSAINAVEKISDNK